MRKVLDSPRLLIMLDQAIFSGSSFVLTILLARMLDMQSFGQYSGGVLMIYLLINGIGAFVIQPFQVLLAKEKNIREYTAFTFWFQVMSIVLVLLIGSGFYAFYSSSFTIEFLMFGAGFLLHDFGRRLLLALNRPFQTLMLDAVSALLSMLALYVYHIQSLNNIGHLLAYLTIAYAASGVLLVVFVQPFYLKKVNSVVFFYQHIKEGKWLFFTAISQWWAANLFVVASGLYLGAAALGALRLAQSLMGVLNMFLQTFENYVLPQTAQKMLVHVSEGLKFVANISRKAGIVLLPVLLLMFVFAERLFVLAGGQEYAAFAFVLQGMSCLYLLVFFSQPFRLFIRAMLLNNHFLYGYLISLTFALLCAHSLLSSYGLIGAIAGLAISQLLLMAYWTIVLQKKKIYLWKSFISF